MILNNNLINDELLEKLNKFCCLTPDTRENYTIKYDTLCDFICIENKKQSFTFSIDSGIVFFKYSMFKGIDAITYSTCKYCSDNITVSLKTNDNVDYRHINLFKTQEKQKLIEEMYEIVRDEIYLKTYLKNKVTFPTNKQREEVFITDYFSNYSGNTGSAPKEYKEIIASIEKYGGFYISKYEIGGNFESKAGLNVLSIDRVTLPRDSGNVIRMIPTASHYDTLFTYLIATGKKSYNDIYKNSESFGVYKSGVMPAGQMAVNGIYDLAGNAWEVTQGKLINATDEVLGTGTEIRRGGYKGNVNKGNIGDIFYKTETTLPTEKGGFRFVLHIK